MKRWEGEDQHIWIHDYTLPLQFHFHHYEQERGVMDLRPANVHAWFRGFGLCSSRIPSHSSRLSAALSDRLKGKKHQLCAHWNIHCAPVLRTHQQLCVSAGEDYKKASVFGRAPDYEDTLPWGRQGGGMLWPLQISSVTSTKFTSKQQTWSKAGSNSFSTKLKNLCLDGVCSWVWAKMEIKSLIRGG